MLEREITTRAYELDRYGRIPAAVLLRYLEHTRWEAGYDSTAGMAGLFSGGRRMVVRAQQVTMGRPLGRAERLRVSLWLEAVGRTSLTMGQRVVDEASGEEVATATVVGVSIDAAGRPAALPESVRDLVSARGLVHQRLGEEAPPAAAFRCQTVVRYSDTDVLQHANHARYADWIEDARAAAVAADALGPAGPLRPPQKLAIEYVHECLVGEVVELSVWAGAGGVVHVSGVVGESRTLAFRAEVQPAAPSAGSR
ncbi:MAG: acyl-[acyl-carrier-protein] thioesterase [Myxococcota bacterium]